MKKNFIPIGIFILILIVFGLWFTLNLGSPNRVTGSFLNNILSPKDLMVPWLVVVAFVVFVIIVNIKKH